MVLGFQEAVQWVKLSSRAQKQWGTLNAGEGCASRGRYVGLHVPSQAAEAPRMCGPVTVLRVMQQPHLKQTRRSHAGALVTRLSPPVAEGDASLQGGSALESTPGSAFVKPGLSHARSHRGTAV